MYWYRLFFLSLFALLFCQSFSFANAATFFVEPAVGSFEMDSTFDVSVYLDTQGESINAVDVALQFPPDKLQIVYPSSLGTSIIGLWLNQPMFDNRNGIVRLQGGIPGGIKASRGLISTFTFRAKGVSTAYVRFLDDSKVLMNNGKGTDVLFGTRGASFRLVLPPPLGPRVVSETHPDQSRWYRNSSPSLFWESDQSLDGYSYVLSDHPVDIPDDISEGVSESVGYTKLAQGVHYFHIKALKNSRWGGTSHYALNIDDTPPARFPVAISPSERTSDTELVLRFSTTDLYSGLARYEMKIIPLAFSATGTQPLFFEVQSPYILKLERGRYDVAVRVYDEAGNYRDVTERVEIVPPMFKIIDNEGVRINEGVTIPWLGFFSLLIILLCCLIYFAVRVRAWYARVDFGQAEHALSNHVQFQLEELKKYRKKYGNLVLFLCFFSLSLFLSSHSALRAFAAPGPLPPPFVSIVSRALSSDDVFYIGGRTELPFDLVFVHLQHLTNGQTYSEQVSSDANGEWFYRHDTLLPPGDYLTWVQSKRGDVFSPPSPQIDLSVRQTALHFGASRISYETLYLLLLLVFGFVGLVLIGYILLRVRQARTRERVLFREIREAEESVRRGFAVLKRDIEAELAVIRKAKLKRELHVEELKTEQQMLRDLASVERYIGKEVWDVGQSARSL